MASCNEGFKNLTQKDSKIHIIKSMVQEDFLTTNFSSCKMLLLTCNFWLNARGQDLLNGL